MQMPGNFCIQPDCLQMPVILVCIDHKQNKNARDQITLDNIMHDKIICDKIMRDMIMHDKIMRDKIMHDRIVRDRILNDEIMRDKIAQYTMSDNSCILCPIIAVYRCVTIPPITCYHDLFDYVSMHGSLAHMTSQTHEARG